MDAHIARAAKFARDRRDVIGIHRLVLKLDVLDHGVVAGNDFRHRVREIGDVAGADVAFDDCQLAVGAGDDEVARQNGFALLLGR